MSAPGAHISVTQKRHSVDVSVTVGRPPAAQKRFPLCARKGFYFRRLPPQRRELLKIRWGGGGGQAQAARSVNGDQQWGSSANPRVGSNVSRSGGSVSLLLRILRRPSPPPAGRGKPPVLIASADWDPFGSVICFVCLLPCLLKTERRSALSVFPWAGFR